MNSSSQLVDLRFGKTDAVVISIAVAAHEESAQALSKKLAKASSIYQNEPAVLDFSKWTSQDFETHLVKLHELVEIAQNVGMNVIEVRSTLSSHTEACEALGMRHETTLQPPASKVSEQPEGQPNPRATATLGESPTPQASQAEGEHRRTRIIDQTVRSGQRIYAKGSDLIVMGQVSPGAEVIADGNVSVYGVLRGRALAGASGDSEANIFSTCFEAELVSVAGYYATFEAGHPEDTRSQPTLIHLAKDGRESLRITPLNIR